MAEQRAAGVNDRVPPLGTQLSRLAAADPDAPAVTHGGRTLTRGQLESMTNRLARGYAALGVRQGDYVTIALPNSIEWVAAVVATWKLGAIPQPLSARLPDAEYGPLLDLRERALLVGRPDPRGVVRSVPGDFDPGDVSDDPLPEAVSPSLKSMASGGSTGRPKLIEAGGDGRFNGTLVAAMMGNRATDTQLVSVPLSHNTGFTSATMALATGQHLVLMSRFDACEFLRLITEHRVNYLATVPTIMQRLLPVYRAGAADCYDLSSVRRWWHLAAPCPPTVKEAWIDILGPEVVWELYGGTELQALTFISGTEWLSRRGSVGQVVSGEMKVLDDDGNECPPGVVGEIYMRPAPGSRPTYRYIGSTARTRPDAEGAWDSLGDLGWFDDEGYLYLADRRVDMFTVGGRNVYPAEIENTLADHPSVLSSLVVGVPHEDLGQVPYALVHAAAGHGLDPAAIAAFVAQRLADYKVPRGVEFVDTPLRDDAGKARRTAVREEVISRMARDVIARPPAPDRR